MSITQTALEGLRKAEKQVQQVAARLAKLPTSSDSSPEDVVDLSAEVISLLEAKNAYSANIKVAQAANEMERNLLDILA